MSLNIGTISSGPNAYFKPEEFTASEALLIEVSRFEPQLPTNYGPRDTITADVTAFPTVEGIDADQATKLKGMKVQQQALVRTLQDHIGGAVVVTVIKLEPTAKLPNGAWVFRPVQPDVVAKVAAYHERLEAAADEMPDFAA